MSSRLHFSITHLSWLSLALFSNLCLSKKSSRWLPTTSSQFSSSSGVNSNGNILANAVSDWLKLGLMSTSEPSTVVMTSCTLSHVPGSRGQERAGHCDCQPYQVHVEWAGSAVKGKQRAVIRRTWEKHAGQWEGTLPQSHLLSGS